MDPYYESMAGEECEDPHCHGCQKPIEDGSVVQFGDGIWHFECFRCAKCQKLVECYSNLLLLRDGSPICEDCSYSCSVCHKTIKDEAIMTGDQAYHADCFRCIQCDKKINDLVFTQTNKGIYCTKCHEMKKQLRLKKRDDRTHSKNATPENGKWVPPVPPSQPQFLGFRSSSTNSIVNAYIEDTVTNTAIKSRDISALNDILMTQRSSEENYRSSLDGPLDTAENQDDPAQVQDLKRELTETKTRLKEVIGKFNKIKTISRNALDEFHMVKDLYAMEVQARREAETQIVRLKSELEFYHQASLFNGSEFIEFSKEEIQELSKTRTHLEETCHQLRVERDSLVSDFERHAGDVHKLLANQKPHELHWERLQQAYQQQLDSMQKEVMTTKSSFTKLMKEREEIISDMILLNSKNAELSKLNNDLSRRMTEREQEAKAVFAGTNFLSDNVESSAANEEKKLYRHRRNLSTGSINLAQSNSLADIKPPETPTKVAQRDSFNGSAAPKLFKFRRNKSLSSKNKMTQRQQSLETSASHDNKLEQASEKKEMENTRPAGKHHFAQQKFLRPSKCESCGEKMWRVNELKCIECGIACHAKCTYGVPQACYRKASTDGSRSDLDGAPLMFGNDLAKQIQAEKSKIPMIVEKCIESVEARGMDYEGIYRKSGGVGQMRQIQQAFEKGEILDLIDEEKWNDICAVTSVLKQYFRDLPNPLFTFELHPKFIDAMMIDDSQEQLQAVSQLIQTLPIENFNTLKYLMEHLDRVQQRNKENLMTSKNLAVIFGPTLLRAKDMNRDLLEMSHKINVIEYILNHLESVFVIEVITNTTDHRRAHLPPLQRGEDLTALLNTYHQHSQNTANHSSDNSTKSEEEGSSKLGQSLNDAVLSLPAVPPRQNANYI
ncbi:hypothetical protein BD560DRAFT_412036 [Blakeslea trispora]|nr:hypothetical protein BD560DRAFT_412036 [Blakeslea trispora]